jgi:hypothetical protein
MVADKPITAGVSMSDAVSDIQIHFVCGRCQL